MRYKIKGQIKSCKREYKEKTQLRLNNLDSVWDSMKMITGIREDGGSKVQLSS